MGSRSKEAEGNVHGNTLSVDSSQVCVLEERHEVSLSGFLQGHDGGGLEAEIGLYTDKSNVSQSLSLPGHTT
jgi:hypothetical protein